MNAYKVCRGGKKDEVQTPKELFALLDSEFDFDWDPCPFTWKEGDPDGLKVPWGKNNFINPPFSNIKDWMRKGVREAKQGKLCVFLVPCRPNTDYWAKYVFPYASEVRMIRKGVKFEGYGGYAPFPVCVVVFRPNPKKRKHIQGGNHQYKWHTFDFQ